MARGLRASRRLSSPRRQVHATGGARARPNTPRLLAAAAATTTPQVCCSGPAEAARALVAMAEAREWLALYRVKDFSVVADWEEGEGEAGGADALPVAFTLLECKWNDMTYFKF